ncbi:hypothetical protein ACVURY_07720, partial [Escherichia coli]
QKQKKLIMLPSETMIWQPEFTDKTLSRKPGAVQCAVGAWLVSRTFGHAEEFFHRRWAKRIYVFYTLAAAEFLLVYSIAQIMKNLMK